MKRKVERCGVKNIGKPNKKYLEVKTPTSKGKGVAKLITKIDPQKRIKRILATKKAKRE